MIEPLIMQQILEKTHVIDLIESPKEFYNIYIRNFVEKLTELLQLKTKIEDYNYTTLREDQKNLYCIVDNLKLYLIINECIFDDCNVFTFFSKYGNKALKTRADVLYSTDYSDEQKLKKYASLFYNQKDLCKRLSYNKLLRSYLSRDIIKDILYDIEDINNYTNTNYKFVIYDVMNGIFNIILNLFEDCIRNYYDINELISDFMYYLFTEHGDNLPLPNININLDVFKNCFDFDILYTIKNAN